MAPEPTKPEPKQCPICGERRGNCGTGCTNPRATQRHGGADE